MSTVNRAAEGMDRDGPFVADQVTSSKSNSEYDPARHYLKDQEEDYRDFNYRVGKIDDSPEQPVTRYSC